MSSTFTFLASDELEILGESRSGAHAIAVLMFLTRLEPTISERREKNTLI